MGYKVKACVLFHLFVSSSLFFLLFFLIKVFLSDTFTCPFLGPLVPLFWISGDVSSGFQSQSGFCLIHIAETNVMYISWDPPLVLHIADLLTDSIAGHQLGSYLAQFVAAVSLELSINISLVPRANHSATRPGPGSSLVWRQLTSWWPARWPVAYPKIWNGMQKRRNLCLYVWRLYSVCSSFVCLLFWDSVSFVFWDGKRKFSTYDISKLKYQKKTKKTHTT